MILVLKLIPTKAQPVINREHAWCLPNPSFIAISDCPRILDLRRQPMIRGENKSITLDKLTKETDIN
jgi:hypothetical protein